MERHTRHEKEEAKCLAAELAAHYIAVRVLPDNSVAALGDLITTLSIVLGCAGIGWGRRFCFVDRALADRRFAELQSEDDEPEGFVARRGR